MVDCSAMSDFLLKSLKKGKEIESAGMKFYNDVANSIIDPKGKSTLLFLAREEGRHMKFMQELIDSITKGEDISKMVSEISPVIFPQKEEFEKGIAASKSDKKIIEEAIGVEERSIEFYSYCLGKTHKAEKSIFRTLVKEEKKHKAWLDFMKEGMEVHGYWYGIEDYFALDG